MQVFICAWLAFFFVSSVAFSQDDVQRVNNLRLWHSPDSTRIVFDVSADVKHTVFNLANPLRLVVDIEDTDLVAVLPTLDNSNSHISAIRTGQPKTGVLRFVFDLKKQLSHRSFVLSPNELYGHRLVLDLEDVKDASIPTVAPLFADKVSENKSPAIKNNESTPGSEAADNSATPEPSTDERSTPTESLPIDAESDNNGPSSSQAALNLIDRTLLVAIDAGHGGEDPGAIGYRGSYEKKLTLEIAKRLEDTINDDPRMSAMLIRTGDYYIKLHKRRIMAREQGADIFISIHADAFTKRSARGFSVFALSQSGATSAMARTLAAKENASDLIGGVSLADKDDVLARVLVDLSMTNTISESVNLGGRVLKQLGKLGRLHSTRVEQAGFAVLKSPDMPSILVETGFITNPQEEKNLKSPRYQSKIANAIYTAIGEYYEQTPHYSNATYASPSVSSANSDQQRRVSTEPIYHRVVRGDSLSALAVRYGTTTNAIKKQNKLRTDTVFIGQKLRLPDGSYDKQQHAESKVVKRPAVHKVGRGDSLSKISIRYNVKISALKRLNNLTSDTVFLGQKIKLPAGSYSLSKDSAKKKQATITHKVKRGDTLSEIAEQYGSSIKEIMQANKLRSRMIKLGQVLKIPS